MFESINLVSETILKLGNYKIKNLEKETFNSEYEATKFEIENITYRSRLAKMTPKKKGYFVVFWKKDESGVNIPFNFSESPEKIIVSVIDKEKVGQFIFPKQVLLDNKILSSNSSKGKMAIRVYPVWEKELNNSAEKTREWQTKYFIDLSKDIENDIISRLYFDN